MSNTERTGTRTRTRSQLWNTGTRTRTRTSVRGLSAAERRRLAMRRWLRHTRLRTTRVVSESVEAITPLGWFVLAITILSIIAGATFAWIEAWFVAIVGATLLIVALPFLIGSRSYQVGIDLERANVVAGNDVHVSIRIHNDSARPALPAVAELPVGNALREITIPLIGPHHSVELPVAVPAYRRGVIRIGPLTIARRDPVGLVRREMTWPEKHLLHVHPVTATLPPNAAGLVRDLEGQASQRLTESDLSFHAIREYVHGDALRHVHWKSTAKTGTLMVRQYEESQTARVAVLFDARRDEYTDDDEFELGVSLAASIAVQAVREGRERYIASAWAPGRVRPSIDGLEELPSRNPAELLDAWAELEPAVDGALIERLARGLAESRRPLSIVAIVTGSRTTLDRIRRAAVSFTPDVHIVVIRAELHAEPKAQRMDPLTLLTAGAIGDLPGLMLRSVQ